MTARGVGLDARIHADPERLLITSVVARLRQGGQLEGDVLLDHWVAPIPGTPEMRAATPPIKRSNGSKAKPKTETVQTTPAPVSPDLHTNGKVDAVLKNVSLDTILDIVGQAPFQRLGLDARFNGLAAAVWTNGDVRTLSVTSKLNVNSSGKSLPDEVPVTGAIDATYTQRDGGVDVRRLEIKLPASNLQAHGHLGAYPLSSPTGIFVDFDSGDLSEFDALFMDLGLTHNGKTGIDALPVSLDGEGNFHGTWSGSVVDPHIAGRVEATNLVIEMPSSDSSTAAHTIHFDSVSATGSYSAQRINVEQGQLHQNQATIDLSGSLSAAESRSWISRKTGVRFKFASRRSPSSRKCQGG